MGVVQNELEIAILKQKIIELENKPTPKNKLYIHAITMDGKIENVNALRKFTFYSTQEEQFTKESLFNYLNKPDLRITVNLQEGENKVINSIGTRETNSNQYFRYNLIVLNNNVFSNLTIDVSLSNVYSFDDKVYEI